MSNKGLEITLQSARTSLPAPPTGTGASIRPLTAPSFEVADINIFPAGGVNFTLTGPVYLYAYVIPEAGSAHSAAWFRMETLEPTSMDLSVGGVSYAVRVSPWFSSLALAAPSWTAGANESVTVVLRPWSN